MSDQELPIKFSDAAATKVLALVSEEENPELKLRVYVTGGGCSGFQYEFEWKTTCNLSRSVISIGFCKGLSLHLFDV